MSAPDPEFWKEAATWLGAALVAPVGYLWKRASGSVQRAEFEKHQTNVREDIRQLYQNAEADRALVRDGFAGITKQLHDVHIDLLEKRNER